MKAYYNDIQNNPDYSSQILLKEKGISIRPTPYMMTPQQSGPHVNISYSKNNMPVSIKPVAPPKPEYVWHQSRTDDGTDLMYYWNTETGGKFVIDGITAESRGVFKGRGKEILAFLEMSEKYLIFFQLLHDKEYTTILHQYVG